MATEFEAVKRRTRGVVQWCVDLRKYDGPRKFFTSKEKAVDFAREKSEEFRRGGFGFEVTKEDSEELRTLRRKLLPLGKTVSEAVDYYLTHYKPIVTKSLPDAVLECLQSKIRTGKSSRYTKKFEDVLKTFIKAYPDRTVSDIAQKDIEAWLFTGDRSPATLNSYLIDVRTFFNWCVVQKYCMTSPAVGMEKILSDPRPPGILTVEQCSSLLESARELEPSILPYFAIGMFCGIRPEEIRKLSLEEMRVDRGHIVVSGEKSKTKQRRIVTVSPNCAEWLRLPGGQIPCINWRKKFDRVREKAGITSWPHDALRHSFVSYHYAIHGASSTAREAGHSEQILHRHYRELVTREDAERFWGIRP